MNKLYPFTIVLTVAAMCATMASSQVAPANDIATSAANAASVQIENASPQQGIDAWSLALIEQARAQVGVTTHYDGAYVGLAYPNGDLPRQVGVCTDVIIRALRDAADFDLQKLVHEDMSANFSSYPGYWGLKRPDSNIDHRRVPNLQTFFERRGQSLPITQDHRDYLPGDIVSWMLNGTLPHIGIISDRVDTRSGEPLIVHNIGAGTREQAFLFDYPITGHYRLSPDI